ncbi:phage tail protein [Snodgrassella communis]|uniref:phage tail protein n=1 Tax=Snodgrassella communis TaxID=2946699 RepID=UPI001EF6C15D|nr:phage tail protein [Snodgrassella communis]
MANLKETSFWEEGIYQWETSDPVLGGENGIDNVPTRQLANRTKWLKDNKLDKSATATNAELAKRARTADRLTDARKVGGVAFDGSADIDLPGVNKPGNQNTSGNAATASKLLKPCKIGGVAFDGSTDIDLPGVNKPGKQHTSGNAGSAFKLYNPRKINGVPFDGTQDINATPAGAVMYFAMDAAPVGWLKANGAAVSRTLYANLFAAIGTRFGAGDGKTTFNLPDLRGYFLRVWDDGKNIDSGRGFGSEQGDAIRNISGFCSGGNVFFDKFTGAFFDTGTRLSVNVSTGEKNNMTDDFAFDASRVVPTAHENRPRNIALLACIKI